MSEEANCCNYSPALIDDTASSFWCAPCTSGPFCMQNTHTHKLTHTYVDKCNENIAAVTCWPFGCNTSSNRPHTQTLAKLTPFINHQEAGALCVWMHVLRTCVIPPLSPCCRKWPLFTCHIPLPPPTHTHTHNTAVKCSPHYQLQPQGLVQLHI